MVDFDAVFMKFSNRPSKTRDFRCGPDTGSGAFTERQSFQRQMLCEPEFSIVDLTTVQATSLRARDAPGNKAGFDGLGFVWDRSRTV